MRLYSHKSYNEYREAQIAKNKRKITSVWAREKDIRMLSEKFLGDAKFGICHGARLGAEVKWFQEYTDAEVIGTDISPTARFIPSMIQWDYHDVKSEWIGKCDFIFSNALDHTHDPKKCAEAWLSCLAPKGICIVEWWDSSTEELDAADCLQANLEEYVEIFNLPGYTVEVFENVSDNRGHWVLTRRGKPVLYL